MPLGFRWAAPIVIVALCPCACDRAENDRSVTIASGNPDSKTSKPNPASEPAPATRPVARCITPMPDRAPEAAPKAATCPPSPGPLPQMPRGYVTFPDTAGKPKVEVELANTQEHRNHGLMYRTVLGDEEGMLFTFSGEAIRTFWMRNTCLPLDMLFIAEDGTIVGILEHVPTLNDEPRAVPCRASRVLELNAGFARAHGIKPGQRIHLDT